MNANRRALVQHQRNAVAVLDVGGVHGDVQQQAERVDQNVALAIRLAKVNIPGKS